MLLAPTNANSWARRVKRIIFDEIHSIGQAEDGVVWEQLLLLAPCQIIALSATVGNPQEFNDWMTTTQKSAGYDLKMIQYQQRYSDLRKFVFTPPTQFAFRGLRSRKTQTQSLGLDGCQGFAFFHPVASLINKSRGMPDDLTLEARDCLTLWESMVKHQTKKYPVPPKLDPAAALPTTIGKLNIFAWEKELKAILAQWMQHNDSPFDDVWEELGKPLHEVQPNTSRVSSRSSDMTSEEEFETIDPNDLCSTTLPLLVELHERNALPTILFNYGRYECERIGRTVLEKLVAAEDHWRESSSEWKKLVAGFEIWKKAKERSSQSASKNAKKSKKSKDDDDPSSKDDAMRDEAGSEAGFYDRFDPTEPQAGFTFADSKKYTSADLKEDFWQLERRGIEPWLREALSRGIGVHHAGMNRKYRQT
jgi:superfamily II RNA helicase